VRTPAEVIRKRIIELEELPRPHSYDLGELANLRASLRLMEEYCHNCGARFVHGSAPDGLCGTCRTSEIGWVTR
jgi:uncharacterized OB-fold protein